MPEGRKAMLPRMVLILCLICSMAIFGLSSPVQAASKPEAKTESATDINDDSATLNGKIESDGNDEITEYGFEWGTSESNLSHKKTFHNDIDEDDEFDYELEDLDEDETYYFRAFAKNDQGTDYGSVKHFTTDENGNDSDNDYFKDDLPLVISKSASSINAAQATLNAEIEEAGDSDIEEYGFFYGTSPSSLNKHEVGTRELNNGDDFNYTLTGLVNGTIYYYKAYAENDDGISYGGLRYFTAGDSSSGDDDIPLVTTVDDVDVDGVDVDLNAEIESIGGSEISEYGFYYGTSTSCSKQKKVGSDSIDDGEDFDCTLKNLRENTTYYYKAYAKNSQGTSYGSIRYFDTDKDEDDDNDDEDNPEVATRNAQTGDGYTTLIGVVNDKGGSDIESYGFYWGTSSSPTTRVEVDNDDIDEDKDFEYQLTGLTSGVTYYYKAYATNDDGTDYGSVLSFTAGGSSSGGGGPASLTTSIGAVVDKGVTINGTITSTGGSTVREYGFIWGKVGGAETKIRLGSSILANTNFGYFITGLEDGSIYYAKSYAVTVSGTSYGAQVGFKANGGTVSSFISIPTVVITSPAAYINVARGALININAWANDATGIEAMGLYVNGLQMSRLAGSNIAYTLDTSTLPVGTCTIVVTAWNGSRAGEAATSFYIQQEAGSISEAPKVNISSPADGYTITAGSTANVSASASSARRIKAMGLYVNGVQKVRFMGNSFTYELESQGLPAGIYAVKVTAWDGVRVAEKTVSITIK